MGLHVGVCVCARVGTREDRYSGYVVVSEKLPQQVVLSLRGCTVEAVLPMWYCNIEADVLTRLALSRCPHRPIASGALFRVV